MSEEIFDETRKMVKETNITNEKLEQIAFHLEQLNETLTKILRCMQK